MITIFPMALLLNFALLVIGGRSRLSTTKEQLRLLHDVHGVDSSLSIALTTIGVVPFTKGWLCASLQMAENFSTSIVMMLPDIAWIH